MIGNCLWSSIVARLVWLVKFDITRRGSHFEGAEIGCENSNQGNWPFSLSASICISNVSLERNVRRWMPILSIFLLENQQLFVRMSLASCHFIDLEEKLVILHMIHSVNCSCSLLQIIYKVILSFTLAFIWNLSRVHLLIRNLYSDLTGYLLILNVLQSRYNFVAILNSSS